MNFVRFWKLFIRFLINLLDLVLCEMIGAEGRVFNIFKLHLKIFGIIHKVFRFETDIALLYFLHVLRVNIFLIFFHARTTFLFASRVSSHFYIFLIHLLLKLDSKLLYFICLNYYLIYFRSSFY